MLALHTRHCMHAYTHARASSAMPLHARTFHPPLHAYKHPNCACMHACAHSMRHRVHMHTPQVTELAPLEADGRVEFMRMGLGPCSSSSSSSRGASASGLQPTWRLERGVCTESLAVEVARSSGVSVIGRARVAGCNALTKGGAWVQHPASDCLQGAGHSHTSKPSKCALSSRQSPMFAPGPRALCWLFVLCLLARLLLYYGMLSLRIWWCCVWWCCAWWCCICWCYVWWRCL